jgi:hypothetical protein
MGNLFRGVAPTRMRCAAALAFAAIALLGAATAARAQSCPKDNPSSVDIAPEASTLHGTVVYHDELREWLGLRLDQSACGEDEIQLEFTDKSGNGFRRAVALRNCGVTAKGKLYNSPSGYYSTGVAMNDPPLVPDASCQPFPVKRDPATFYVPDELKLVHATITVDYRNRGHVDVKTWYEAKKEQIQLKPWQTYINYFLTGGGDTMWISCRKYFRMDKNITQDPKASADQIIPAEEDGSTSLVMANLKGVNTVTFACKRVAQPYEMQDNTRKPYDPSVPD